MARLSNISKKLLEQGCYGAVTISTNKGRVILYVTNPNDPDRFGYSTRWTDPKNDELRLRTIECTIPEQMVRGKSVDSYKIGQNTYLLPEVIFNKVASNWKITKIG